jgi:Na+/proline symporter/nitrogen-specific signal transduction histidine kinase
VSLSPNTILLVSVAYVALLFLLAWRVDKSAARGGGAWLRSPITYTLSLSVYCTAWTFYGAVGSAARSGLEFATIYLGPTLVFIGWWWLIRKIVRIGRVHRITSIADMISSRYGKSGGLAALATVVAVVAATPYIALQLQSLTLSYEAITGGGANQDARIAFWAALGLGIFTILFGTRSLDENERHYGVVAAIAVEAIVKLTALIAIGIYAVFYVAGGVEQTFASTTSETLQLESVFGPRWMTLLFLSGAAIICLPRQFQVMVVENTDERHLATASWLFPAYLLLISLFVLPIALIGRAALPEGANPDLFVLTLPLTRGDNALAVFAFIGGFSAATSMVIVSTIALSTMVSNHIVAPVSVRLLALRGDGRSGDVRRALLSSRRAAILIILGLGYIYFRVAGRSEALAATGLIAFCGVAQFLPALLAGVFWRGATKAGAIAGLFVGFGVWLYTLYLPSLGGDVLLPASIIADGAFGLASLRPYALFGTGGDPLVHATVWSTGLNIMILVLVSLASRVSPLERLQSALFVDVFRAEPLRAFGLVRRSAASGDLFLLAQRILGTSTAAQVFTSAARRQGKSTGLPDPTPIFISRLERELAGSVGAASAHAMVNRIAGGETISMDDLVEIADENAKLRRTTEALRAKSAEAELSAQQLRRANEQLKTLDAQKDEFLSQVSHELRTPMTSVRSFAEIIEKTPDLDAESRNRFAGIIQAESLRLTRLLDEIRDLSFLDDPHFATERRPVDADTALRAAAEIATASHSRGRVRLTWDQRAGDAVINADPDRLAQVFINLISNAIIHNPGKVAKVELRSSLSDGFYHVEVIDNGPGVAPEDRERIFETFFRRSSAGSAGLGLPICRKIMRLLDGTLEVHPAEGGGSRFIVSIPLVTSPVAA